MRIACMLARELPIMLLWIYDIFVYIYVYWETVYWETYWNVDPQQVVIRQQPIKYITKRNSLQIISWI